MRRNPRDPRGYYQVLNISPGASVAEVKLAYTFLKNAWQKNRSLPRARIREAYEFLTDPQAKATYDAGGSRGSRVPPRLVGTLALLTGLVAFAGFVFPAFLLPSPDPFSVGAVLVARHDHAPLGEIVRRESHTFANGLRGDAYLVRLTDGGEKWFPASDLESHYRQRVQP